MGFAAVNPRGFSLIELVIVLAIIGVIGAIAVPRLSTVSADAPLTVHKADLATLQNAVELYTAEHVGKVPDKNLFAQQLTQFTDIHGAVSAVRTSTHIYGPYIRKIPEMLASPRVTSDEMVDTSLTATQAADEVLITTMSNKTTAWLFNTKTGRMRVKVVMVAGGKSVSALEAEAALN